MRILISLLCIVAIVVAEKACADAPVPNEVVQGMIDELDNVMKARRPELQKNHEALLKVIDDIVLPHFDIDYASILMLGQNARTATAEQRVRFSKAMYTSITRRYADGVLQYAAGAIRVISSNTDLNDRRSLVRTEVKGDDGKVVPVDYAFHKTSDGDWQFYDVIVEGISYVTNYRNQVTTEIQKSGIDAVILHLESQGVDALESKGKDASGK